LGQHFDCISNQSESSLATSAETSRKIIGGTIFNVVLFTSWVFVSVFEQEVSRFTHLALSTVLNARRTIFDSALFASVLVSSLQIETSFARSTVGLICGAFSAVLSLTLLTADPFLVIGGSEFESFFAISTAGSSAVVVVWDSGATTVVVGSNRSNKQC
jgi:hypothetical protein